MSEWQENFIARELPAGTKDERHEIAARMITTAIRVGDALDYPVPVVTQGLDGLIGVRWDWRMGSLMAGYGLATGMLDGEEEA